MAQFEYSNGHYGGYPIDVTLKGLVRLSSGKFGNPLLSQSDYGDEEEVDFSGAELNAARLTAPKPLLSAPVAIQCVDPQDG